MNPPQNRAGYGLVVGPGSILTTEDLVRQAAEMHWSYDGHYYFLSNNCAVETLKLLRSGTGNPRLAGLDSIMPNGLLEVLQGRGLADMSVLDDPREALRLGYHFDSFRERYQAMFDVLRKHLPIKQTQVEDWLALSKLTAGPLFRKVDRWGHLSEAELTPSSIIPILRRLLSQAGVADADAFSSHSLRRGFATWATANGWDLKALMTYVGWKDIKSAMRYIDPAISFGGLAAKSAVERHVGPTGQLPASQQ